MNERIEIAYLILLQRLTDAGIWEVSDPEQECIKIRGGGR
jgi:hypothetical protein